MQMFPTIAYHKTLAPEGQLIQSAEQLSGLGEGWVDTPAAFDPNYVRPEPVAPSRAGAGPRRPGAVQEFPAVRYNRVGEDRLVRSVEEADALDPEEWKASPADFPPVAAAPAALPPAPAPAAVTGEGEDAEERDRKAAEAMAAKARILHNTPVAEATRLLEGADAATLRFTKELEALNPEPRITLIRFIDAALKALDTPAPSEPQ